MNAIALTRGINSEMKQYICTSSGQTVMVLIDDSSPLSVIDSNSSTTNSAQLSITFSLEQNSVSRDVLVSKMGDEKNHFSCKPAGRGCV